LVRYWRLLRHGAPLYSSSKYDSFSLGNLSSEMSEPRVDGPRLPQRLLAGLEPGLVEDVVGEKSGSHELG
jgi:hypothetical protein